MKRFQASLIKTSLVVAIVVGCAIQSAEAQYRRQPQPQRQPQQYAEPAIMAGIGGALNIPFEDTEDFLDISASLHGTLLFHIDPSIKFETDLGYWFLQASNDVTDQNDDPSLLTLTGGIRYYLNRALHVDAGMGLYRFDDWQYTLYGVTNTYEDQNELGMYAGIGIEQFPFDIALRLHHSDFYTDDFWNLGLSVRVFFGSNGSLW